MDDKSREGSSTPSQFASQSATTEDLLKSQTVGLVKLADFRKRRAEVLELKEREAAAQDRSGTSTPFTSGNASPKPGASSAQPAKKKRKAFAKGKLSFGIEDEEENAVDSAASAEEASQSNTPVQHTRDATPADDEQPLPRRLGPNAAVGNAPKVMTKSALMKEAQTREQLRKDFLIMQEAVKATEILIPYVFYDGTSTPGGVCKVKKGDFIWLFLDRSRKVGATMGATGGDKSRKEWARIGVDDLMLVRGEIIIPHHYDFYYFIVNKTKGFSGTLFDYSAQPTTSSNPPISENGGSDNRQKILEGATDDPNMTKVVDRRWYERNKHIFPASVWEEFDPSKDYTKGIRKDTQGNNYFFS